MASSSLSTPPTKYDVFLSFRAEDTHYNFVSHLYEALVLKKFRTYMFEHDLQKGQSISQQLKNAIEESKCAIIIFSKNYASSTWCLDELVKIMEFSSKGSQIVIPIFYEVDPSDIRSQTNSVAESFAEHELRFKDNMEKVKIWRENLTKAANLSGYDLSQSNLMLAPAIKKIVEEIVGQFLQLAYTKGLVGMEDRLKILELLVMGEHVDCFLGILGMEGVGKTVTARAFFDKLIDRFEEGYFLEDVYRKDIMNLQKYLLSKVLRAHVKIRDIYEGSSLIRTHFCSKRILLVVDSVDNITQLEALAGDYSWFGPGSKIIITTRDVDLLNEAEVNVICEVKTLSYNKAMELFCWHAFRNIRPTETFVQLSDRVVKYASGIPLALVVLGSYLHGLGIDVWESSLARLEDAPEGQVFAALKISFEELNDFQRDIFLDIACFSNGNHIDEVKQKLSSFDFNYMDSINVLIARSFIQILNGNIEMHNLIREMGWSIVRHKANNEPENYTRLWNREDIIDVLMNNVGTMNIEGLVLKEEGRFMLSKGAFRNMNNLRLLEIYNHNFQGSPNYLPNSLRWLRWDNYPAKSLPENFKPARLISLQLCDSSILQTPDISDMQYLEILDLSRCIKLFEVHPSIGVHQKLVHLNMSGCFILKKFPKIIQMESLEILNLHGCSALKYLPEFHSNMSRLKILNLQHTIIFRLPWSVGHLTSLQEIDLYGCKNLISLPIRLCELKDLESIALSGSSKLEYFSENSDDGTFDNSRAHRSSLKKKIVARYDASKILTAFLNLPLLRKLYMANCNVLELITSESIGFLSSLQELDIGGNDFTSLPESINSFSCLEVLHLEGCKMLQELPELPLSIRKLFLNNCTALTRIPYLVVLLRKYENLHHLSLLDCMQLFQEHEQIQTIVYGQSRSSLLTFFRDWQSMSDVLCMRQEVLLVYLPKAELPDWLNQIDPDTAEFPNDQNTIFSPVTITLYPSSYNDKLRGFALCAISKAFDLKVVTSKGQEINTPTITDINGSDSDQIVFLYIPISKLTSSTKLKTEMECLLFEVTNDGPSKKNNNFGAATLWRICLVYEDKVDIDISDLPYTIRPNPTPSDGSKLKIFVGAGINVASGSYLTP